MVSKATFTQLRCRLCKLTQSHLIWRCNKSQCQFSNIFSSPFLFSPLKAGTRRYSSDRINLNPNKLSIIQTIKDIKRREPQVIVSSDSNYIFESKTQQDSFDNVEDLENEKILSKNLEIKDWDPNVGICLNLSKNEAKNPNQVTVKQETIEIVKDDDDDREPVEPGESECCGNGCEDCVWVEYWEKSEAWRERQSLKKQAQQN